MSATTREMIRGWIDDNKKFIASCHKQITEAQQNIERAEKKMEENQRAHDILEKAGIP